MRAIWSKGSSVELVAITTIDSRLVRSPAPAGSAIVHDLSWHRFRETSGAMDHQRRFPCVRSGRAITAGRLGTRNNSSKGSVARVIQLISQKSLR